MMVDGCSSISPVILGMLCDRMHDKSIADHAAAAVNGHDSDGISPSISRLGALTLSLGLMN